MFGVVLNGAATVSQAGYDEVIVSSGDAVVWSNSSVGHSFYNAPIELLSVAVPRSVLERNRVHPDRMAFSRISRDSVPLNLLSKYLQVLLREFYSTGNANRRHRSRSRAYDDGPGEGADNDPKIRKVSLRAVRMQAIKSDIAANLRNRQLTINAVAARGTAFQQGISANCSPTKIRHSLTMCSVEGSSMRISF